MLHKINQLSVLVMTFCTAAMFLLSLIFCRKGYNPPYMRSLPLYFFADILTDVFVEFNRSYLPVAYIIFTIFELLYFSYFLSQVVHSRRTRQIMWILDGLYLFLMAWITIRYKSVPGGAVAILLECFILIIPCLVFLFKDAYSIVRTKDLRKEPSYWMVRGITFYFVLLIAIIVSSTYYYYQHKYQEGNGMYSFNTAVQLFSYYFFLKAMTCRKPA